MPPKVFKKYNLVKLIKVIHSSLIVRLTITSRISVIIKTWKGYFQLRLVVLCTEAREPPKKNNIYKNY